MGANLEPTETLFSIWLIGGEIVIRPDVPWTLLLVGEGDEPEDGETQQGDGHPDR